MGRANRVVQAGVAVTGLGGTITAVVLAYTLSNNLTFWNGPFILSVACTAIGLILLVIGMVVREGKSSTEIPSMSQSSGDNSNNIQAGRDISLNGGCDVQE